MVAVSATKDEITRSYNGLYYCVLLRSLGLRTVTSQTFAMSLLWTVGIVAASIADNTVIMHDGNVGILQHPAVWSFLLLQTVLPVVLLTSASEYLDGSHWRSLIGHNCKEGNAVSLRQQRLLRFFQRKTNLSKAIYWLFISVGLICFIWNSYQNQRPIQFLGVDFWDSFHHQYGYWMTRAYKFYLWILLLPSLAHLYLGLLIAIRTELVLSISNKTIRIDFFDEDGCGGVGAYVRTALRPMTPALWIVGLTIVAVASIHREFDVTPIIGLILTCSAFLLSYLVPASALRGAIALEKRRHLRAISEIQSRCLDLLTKDSKSPSEKGLGVERINELSQVIKHIRAVPSWPLYSYVMKCVGTVASSGVLASIWGLLRPVIQRKLGLP